ncbi:MAG: hypothetical protein QOG91_629 [Candidatus Parcubacteria bacterium]|nr:hypothetical protein [Candidatus Parcubacteria bacterium]
MPMVNEGLPNRLLDILTALPDPFLRDYLSQTGILIQQFVIKRLEQAIIGSVVD